MNRLFSLAIVALLSFACSNKGGDVQTFELRSSVRPEVKPSSSISSLPITRSQQTAFECSSSYSFKALREMHRLVPNRSHLVSPLGYTILLPMVAELAGEDYIDAMKEELGIQGMPIDDIHRGVGSLMSSMPALDLGTEVSFANLALSADSPSPLFPDSSREVWETYYSALVAEGTHSKEFASAASKWVYTHTGGRISEPVIIEGTVLVSSSFYFEAPLKYAFNPKQTSNASFWGTPDKSVSLPMMHADFLARYMQNELYDAIKLPVGDNAKFSLIAVLPHSGTDIPTLLEKLEKENIKGTWKQDRMVRISIPKISLSAGVPLSSFSSTLSEIVEKQLSPKLEGNIGILGIVQNCDFTLDETGMKGTGRSMMSDIANSLDPESEPVPEPFVFNANRPFIFTVIVEDTQIALYAGLYCNQGNDHAATL